MEEKSLYQTLLDQGVPQTDIGNHYSDLYVRVTRKTKEIIQDYIQRNGLKGSRKYFVPILREKGTGTTSPLPIPFWEERRKKKGAGTMKDFILWRRHAVDCIGAHEL